MPDTAIPLPLDMDKALPERGMLSFKDVGFSVHLLDLLWRSHGFTLEAPQERIEALYFGDSVPPGGEAWRAMVPVHASFWWDEKDCQLYSPYILEVVGRPQPRRPIPKWMKWDALYRASRCTLGSEFYACEYCGVDVGEDFHFDHALPLSRGGFNHPRNLNVACPECNLAKGAMTEREFKEALRRAARAAASGVSQ